MHGFVDSGYTGRVERDTDAMTVTGPPAGIVGAGGYRFVLSELQDLVGQAEPGAILAALPDALAGQRLAGDAADRGAVQQALAALGLNALVADAFRDRRNGEAA